MNLFISSQVSQMSKSQNSLVAEDRRVVLAEQQACMERLVNLISASINRDLPLRMEGIVRAEVCCLWLQPAVDTVPQRLTLLSTAFCKQSPYAPD